MSSFERLVARAFRHPAAPETPCPAAETLAAYLEHNLSSAERHAVERHASLCGRCARHLAALVQLDDQLSAGQPLAAAPWRWWRPWQWLVPAASAVVVFAVWTSLPEDRGPSTPPQRETQVSAPQQDVRLKAKPPLEPAHTTPASPAKSIGAEEDRRQRGPQSSGAAAVPPSPARRDTPQPGAVTGTATPPPAAAPMLDTMAEARKESTAAPQAAARVAPAAPPAESSQDRAPAENEQSEPRTLHKAAPAMASESARADSAKAEAPRAELKEQLGVAAAPARLSDSMLVRSPNPLVLWRIAPPVIERSSDGGRTWSTETTPPLPGRLSGSAPSADVCWLAGENGFVARRDAAGRWAQAASPAAAPVVRIEARSALEATVTLADGRTFSTRDGGTSWTAGSSR